MDSRVTHTRKHGFSLVELSIVLVILGLLTGGILAGQSLIRAAELRAVATEYGKYTAATQAFRDKYFAIPGDMPNAQSFWGIAAACPGTTTTPGQATCNGSGNGMLDTTNEVYAFWQHLANAGLIEGQYTGTDNNGVGAVLGSNLPKSKLSNGGWGAGTFNNASNTTDLSNFAINFGNLFTFGSANNIYGATGFVLKGEEAWNIDTKFDDGKPGQGRVYAANVNACTDRTNATNFTANYLLNSSGIICTLYFANAF